MSHNFNAVSTQAPDSSGAITISLSDVSSVSNPLGSEVLNYNGSAWVNSPLSIVDPFERSAYSASLTGSGATNSTTILLDYIYGPSPRFYRFLNKQTSGTATASFTVSSDVSLLEDVTGTTIWFYGFKFLTAGVYRVTAKLVVGPNSTDTSFVDLQLSNADNTITYGPRVRVGNVNTKQANIVGIVEASANDEVGFYKHAIINAPKYAKLGDINILVTIERLS